MKRYVGVAGDPVATVADANGSTVVPELMVFPMAPARRPLERHDQQSDV
jgi:hypothetical protein